jgi:hypothetical protein
MFGTKCFCKIPETYGNEPCQNLWFYVSYIFVALEVNKYSVENEYMHSVYVQ